MLEMVIEMNVCDTKYARFASLRLHLAIAGKCCGQNMRSYPGVQLSPRSTSQFVLAKNRPLVGRIFSPTTLIPGLVVIWFLYFMFVRYDLVAGPSLRGDASSSPKFGSLDSYGQQSQKEKKKITDLVIVPGHAVMRLTDLASADSSDASWYLLPYQRNQGFPLIIRSHVQAGIKAATLDEQAMLMFSGGETRLDVGPTSEAASYYYLASAKKWINRLSDRVFLEEYARDSFENLLFSVCRFREVQGYYPSKITVVGFDFKGKRYAELHRKAIGYPEGNFSYIGIRSSAPFDQARAERGELEAYGEFQNDMYGCNDRALREKRGKRNPFKRTVPYALACPELGELFDWCGPGLYDFNKLPWGDNQPGAEGRS